MWKRSDLKSIAKNTLKLCYWKAVLVSFIFTFTTTGFYSWVKQYNSSSSRHKETLLNSLNSNLNSTIGLVLIPSIIFALIFGIICYLIIGIFLFPPIEVGANRFFMFSGINADLSNIVFAFKQGYLNIVKILFLRGLFTLLWSFLLWIPGLIKYYEYRMIPYLLAENPYLSRKEAFEVSRTMMSGEKWNTFVLDLSFLGWILLSLCTCGILSLFYVNPYIRLTNANLYFALKNKCNITQQTY